MKKIVIITGSLRTNSNSGILADSFENTVKASGVQVVRINASKLNIGACHACMSCYSTGKACTFDDDFNKVVEELMDADGILIACPVYWYSFPAKVKALIDKFYALYNGGYSFEGKKCALLTCCEDTDDNTFTGINFAFDETFKLMKAEIVGKVEVTGVAEAGEILRTDGQKQAERLAQLFVKNE